MIRPILHTVFLALLAALGWAVQLTVGYPWDKLDDLGTWGWVPAIAGSAWIAVCAVLCFVAARGKRVFSPALLLMPIAILLTAAVVWRVGLVGIAGEFGGEGIQSREHVAQLGWFGRKAAPVQFAFSLGALWAGLMALAVVAVAGCARVEGPRDKRPDTLRWAWPLAGVCATAVQILVVALGYAGLRYYLVGLVPVPSWPGVLFAASDLLCPAGRQLLLPMFACLVLSLSLPLLALPLRPRIDEILGNRAATGLNSSRSLATSGAVLAAVCLGFAAWLHAAALNAYWIQALAGASTSVRQQYLSSWGFSCTAPSRMYLAGMPLVACTAVVAILLLAPLLFTALRRPSRWIAPAILVVLTLLILAGIRMSCESRLERCLQPRCEEMCLEVDRLAATVLLLPRQVNAQIWQDPCPDPYLCAESDDFRLPRAASVHGMGYWTTVKVTRSAVEVDRVAVPLRDERLAHLPACDHAWIERLWQTLHEKAEDAAALATRNPNQPFKGRVLLVIDASTLSGTVDCIRVVAAEAGFHDQRVLVGVTPPGQRGVGVSWVYLEPPAGQLLPGEGEPRWSLHLGTGDVTLESPRGGFWTATDIEGVIEPARQQLAMFPAPRTLWVTRDPSVTLQQDLDARGKLTQEGLFDEALSLPATGEAHAVH